MEASSIQLFINLSGLLHGKELRMTHEVIIPSRYILTPDVEVGAFVGVAYKLPDGKVKNELLLGTNSFLSVQMISQANKEGIFAVYHIFVERYVNTCLKRTIDDVDIFRFHLSRGDFPERPSELQGLLTQHFISPKRENVWTSYEHISGPYLADPQFISSALSAGRLDYITPVTSQNLVLDRAAYRRNPHDLPMMGVIIAEDEVSSDYKYLEDMVIRTKTKKPTFIN